MFVLFACCGLCWFVLFGCAVLFVLFYCWFVLICVGVGFAWFVLCCVVDYVFVCVFLVF